jgi:hypothetical protein
LPAAATTVAGPKWDCASARAATFSRSIDMSKRRMPANRARSVSAVSSALPTPPCCQLSTTAIATSAASKFSCSRM